MKNYNTYNNELTPETAMQELWELNGRVLAVKAYCAVESYPRVETIKALLGLTDAADERLTQLEAENDSIRAMNYDLRKELETLKKQSADEFAEIVGNLKAVGDGE